MFIFDDGIFAYKLNFFNPNLFPISRILKSMSDIYYGRRSHPWAISLENWSFDPNEMSRLEDYKNDIKRQLVAEI